MLYANGTSCPYVQDSTAGKLNPGHLQELNFGKLNDIKSPILSIKNDDLRYILHLAVCLYFACHINHKHFRNNTIFHFFIQRLPYQASNVSTKRGKQTERQL